MLLLAGVLMAACGDDNDDKKFDPETDWLVMTVDKMEDLNTLGRLHDEVFPNDCPSGNICPSPGARGYFRNVAFEGNLSVFEPLEGNSKLNITTLSVYGGIRNLDLSRTRLKELSFRVFPPAVKTVVLPETLTDMGAGFMDCRELTEMVIPGNVISVNDHNFRGLDKLREVVVNAPIPPQVVAGRTLGGGDVFPDAAWKLTVPTGSKAAYEAHEWWGLFTDITEK